MLPSKLFVRALAGASLVATGLAATSLVATSLVLGAGAAYAQQAGVTKDQILIGGYGPITGSAAYIGLGARDGAELAIKEINDAGGVHGRKLKLLFEDDGFSPSKALAAVKKLTEQDRVFMMLGLSGSNPTVGTIEYSKQAKIPTYIAVASAPQATHPFERYMFRGGATESARYGELNAEYLIEFLQAKRIAMLSGADEYAKNEGDNTEKMLQKWYGVKLLMRAEFKVGDKDFTPQLLQVKQANPDFIITFGQVPEVSILLRQARELGIRQAIMGGAAAIDNGLIATAGLNAEGYTGGWLSGQFLDSVHPDMVRFRDAWAKLHPDAPKGRPNLFDMLGYTETYVVAEAMKRAGPDLTRDKLVDALETIENFKVSEIATPRTFTKWHHIGNFQMQYMVVLGQHFVPVRFDPHRESEILKEYKN
jgi:branched-chain amino acid transport system substrate-binding protein